MPDTTITGLPNASALSGTERVPMDQSGTTVDAAASAIAALATAATVGLGNVNNTSDANKPISTATQTALDGKAAAGAIGSSGLTMTAGVLGRESGTGAPVVLTLSGLSIVNGVLTVSAPISSTYTASGAISTSDRIALVNSASAAAMTLGSGTTNGQVMVIKRYGAGSVTITANLDGVSNSSIVADSTTIKESVTLAWSASLSTWLVL